VSRILPALAIVAIAACSSLPDAGNGIVALQIFPPDALVVVVDSAPVMLHARALDIHGDSVAAIVFWRTPDTAFVSLDSVTGVMVGDSVGSARVQARVGTLLSDPISFVVRAADTTHSSSIRKAP